MCVLAISGQRRAPPRGQQQQERQEGEALPAAAVPAAPAAVPPTTPVPELKEKEKLFEFVYERLL